MRNLTNAATWVFVCSLVVCVVSLVAADGIPVSPDKKHVQGNFTRVILDEKQIVDVETKREVTLRQEQKSELERIAGGPLGDVAVYSSRYNMCTCFDAAVVGIWTEWGVLEFPNERLYTHDKQQVLEKEIAENLETDDRNTGLEFAHLIVIFDSLGEMYLHGQHMTITQIEKEIEMLSRKEPKEPKNALHRLVIFDPPPPIGEEAETKVLSEYRELVGYCQKRAIRTQDWGVVER